MSLQKTTIARIKLAAPLTMLMFTVLLERVLLKDILAILSFSWFTFVIGFFVCSTIFTGVLIYTYQYFSHLCKACKEPWMRIRTPNILISSSFRSMRLFRWIAIFRINSIVKTYTCRSCTHIDHKKSKSIQLVKFGTMQE